MEYWAGKKRGIKIKQSLEYNTPSRKGLTLIEVLVCCFLFTAIMASVSGVFSVGNRCWNIDMGILELQQQARQAMEGMSREIRQCNPASISITNSNTTITFTIDSYLIEYRLQSGKITRRQSGQDRVLGNNIKDLFFSQPSSSVVQVKIDLEKKTIPAGKVVFSCVGKVRLRNG